MTALYARVTCPACLARLDDLALDLVPAHAVYLVGYAAGDDDGHAWYWTIDDRIALCQAERVP